MSDQFVDSGRIGADYSVTAGEPLKNILRAMVRIKRPVMVWGGPGVGKSGVAEQLAGELQYADAEHTLHPWQYFDIRSLLYETVDLRGLPFRDPKTNTVQWATPSFLPPPGSDASYLVNLEELPNASPSMQTALYQLVHDRRCGDYVLPDGAAVIACGNRMNDRGGTFRMLAPLASRFVHVDVKPDAMEWCRWAAQKGLAAEVQFFVRYRQELLYGFDPKSRELAFPCPRTWQFVSEIVDSGGLSPEELRIAIRGTVGEAAAIEFCSFLNVWRGLPHPNTILQHPETAPIPGETGTLLALCGSLYRVADEDTIDSIIAYATRIADRKSPEIAEFLVGQCSRHDPMVQQTKAWIRYQARMS